MSLHFVAECSAAQQQQRYEDVLLQDPAPAGDCCSRSFSCWALFDGHNGDTVARFLGSSLLPELESRLPAMPLPQEEPEQYVYADAVRRAVTAAFLSLSLRVSGLAGGAAAGCGSAAAVVVQTGQLLTVANTGSSKCVLDVGHCAIECSADHRLGNNEDEEERLSAGEPRAVGAHAWCTACIVEGAAAATTVYALLGRRGEPATCNFVNIIGYMTSPCTAAALLQRPPVYVCLTNRTILQYACRQRHRSPAAETLTPASLSSPPASHSTFLYFFPAFCFCPFHALFYNKQLVRTWPASSLTCQAPLRQASSAAGRCGCGRAGCTCHGPSGTATAGSWCCHTPTYSRSVAGDIVCAVCVLHVACCGAVQELACCE